MFAGKMETFLICFRLTGYLREKFLNEEAANFFEEAALNAIYKSAFTAFSFVDARLLLAELPKILPLNYSVAKDIHRGCITLAEQIVNSLRPNINLNNPNTPLDWKELANLKYLIEMMKTFERN